MFVGSNALLKSMKLVKLFVNDYCDALGAKKATNKQTRETTGGGNYNFLWRTRVSRRPCFHPIKSSTMHPTLELWISFSMIQERLHHAVRLLISFSFLSGLSLALNKEGCD